MKIQKKNIYFFFFFFFFFSFFLGGGGQGGCERRKEAFVKIQKKKWGGDGWVEGEGLVRGGM